jgi:(1->4)-alpha-D-glucan 1-alpha-D-glucosylmutase
VDPDNRRPVDFATRRRMLTDLLPCLTDKQERAATVARLLENWTDGRIKLYLTASLLRLRRERPQVFLEGSYEPLAPIGERAAHVVAFARRHEGGSAIAVVPRLVAGFENTGEWPTGAEVWRDTRLRLPADASSGSYTSLFTGEGVDVEDVDGRSTVTLSSVFRSCPVAVLVS